MTFELIQRDSERGCAFKVKADATTLSKWTVSGKWTAVAKCRADNEARWFKAHAKELFTNIEHTQIVNRGVMQVTTIMEIEGGAIDFIPIAVTAIEGRVEVLFLATVRSENPEIKNEALVTISVRGALKAIRTVDAE